MSSKKLCEKKYIRISSSLSFYRCRLKVRRFTCNKQNWRALPSFGINYLTFLSVREILTTTTTTTITTTTSTTTTTTTH